MLIQAYSNIKTKKILWHKEGDPLPGEGWIKIPRQAKYITKKAEMDNKYLLYIQKEVVFTFSNVLK